MIKVVLIIAVILVTSSCRKLVQSDFPDFESATTLNAILQADTLVKVHVSTTDKLSADTLEYVTNAEVNLFINNKFVEKLLYGSNGFYTSNIRLLPLDTLRCEVNTMANDTTRAECVVPMPSRLLSTQIIHNSWVNNEGRSSPAIQFTLKNNVNEPLYYEARVAIYSGFGDTIEYYKFSDEFSLLLFSNQNEPDSLISKFIEFEIYTYSNNEKYAYILELRSVSESYYKYAQSVILYEQGRYPSFDVGAIVPYNLYSNVENGYGIFASYSTCFSDLTN